MSNDAQKTQIIKKIDDFVEEIRKEVDEKQIKIGLVIVAVEVLESGEFGLFTASSGKTALCDFAVAKMMQERIRGGIE